MADPEVTDPPEPSTDALPPEQEERIVDKVVNRVRDVVDDLIGKAKGGDPVADDEPVVDDDTPDPLESPRTTEANMESEVKAALEKIQAEERHAEDHARLEREAERAPVTLGRITQKLWGDPS